MATEIASAYISLIPSFQGGQAAIASQMGAPAAAAGRDAGGRFGGAFGGAFTGILGAGALLGGMALISDVLQQSITQADLPGTMKSQFALGEADAAAAAKAAGTVYAEGFGESLEAVGNTAGTVKKALNDLGDTSDLTKMTTQAQALADKFGEDVSPLINSASQLVKTGLAPNMDAAMDLMTAGFQNGANAGDDLLDTITEYSTKFRDLGLSGQEALGLINQGLAAGARSGDLVADALKEFSIRAIDGSKLTSEGFQAVGLDAESMAAKIAGGGDGAAKALDQTLDALRNIEDPVARDAAAVALFGTQAEDLGDSLYALDPSDAAKKLGKVGDAAGKLTDSKGAAQSITALGRSFKKELGDAITPVLPALSTVFELLKPLLPVLTPLAVAIGVVALAVGVIAAAQWAWNAALAANPLGIIIGAIIIAAALIITYWDEILAFLTMVWEGIKSVAVTVWTAIVDFFTAVWDGIVADVTAAWDFIVGLIVGYYTMLWNIAVTVFTAIVDFLAAAWQWIVEAATAAWEFIVSLVVGYFTMLWTTAVTVFQAIVDFLAMCWQWIQETAAAVWQGIIDALSAAWAWIVSIVDTGVQNVLDYIAFLASLPGKAAKWFGGLLSAATKKFGELVSWAKRLPGRVLDALGNIGSKLLNAGKNLIDGLLRGMKNAWGAVKSWILDKLKGFKDTVLNFFGIASPSKLFTWIGEMTWAGFPKGAEKQKGALAASTDEMMALAVPSADMLAGSATEQGGDLTATIPIDLGEGIQQTVQVKLQRQNRQLRRGALAGSGAGL